ncbi:MAG: prohibitin family protein [Cytophagales bacterium]|nr:prohibitin family protein [Cytophagales bacterium]
MLVYIRKFAVPFVLVAFFTSCAVIRPGEVGLVQTLGKLSEKPIRSGVQVYFLFTTKVIHVPVRTVEVIEKMVVNTKEGLNVTAEVSLLYNVNPDSVRKVYTQYGINYEEVVVQNVFRSVIRHICANFYAKDLYVVDRKEFEKLIFDGVVAEFKNRGFKPEAVLLRGIEMPQQIFRAIEDRMQAEQEALKMEYVVNKQRKEADRMQIEAEAIKKYNQTISEGLNENIVKWKALDVYKGLITSPNSKVIISNGSSSPLISTDGK